MVTGMEFSRSGATAQRGKKLAVRPIRCAAAWEFHPCNQKSHTGVWDHGTETAFCQWNWWL